MVGPTLQTTNHPLLEQHTTLHPGRYKGTTLLQAPSGRGHRLRWTPLRNLCYRNLEGVAAAMMMPTAMGRDTELQSRFDRDVSAIKLRVAVPGARGRHCKLQAAKSLAPMRVC